MMREIIVPHATGSYPICIGEDLIKNHSLLQKYAVSSQVCVVTNERVAPLYLQYLQEAYQNYQLDVVVLPDGETHKNLEQFMRIMDELVAHQHHRDTTLVALGGGVVGDMTGFAAACYHRGVAFMQIPTTLLSQVDASIGGKTAVNHPLGKNLIGAFHQPQAVLIDVSTLKSLPEREFQSGLAEIIKAALIKDAEFFSWLEENMSLILQRNTQILTQAILRACTIKRDVVANDEKETGERALLNFGHTFGHGIEQVLEYKNILHGEAVSIGMVMAAKLSLDVGELSAKDCKRILHLLQAARLPVEMPKTVTTEALLHAMLQDKKILKKKMRFILLKQIGESYITSDLEYDFIKSWLQQELLD
jgi:3-dehydroquinate synthase